MILKETTHEHVTYKNAKDHSRTLGQDTNETSHKHDMIRPPTNMILKKPPTNMSHTNMNMKATTHEREAKSARSIKPI